VFTLFLATGKRTTLPPSSVWPIKCHNRTIKIPVPHRFLTGSIHNIPDYPKVQFQKYGGIWRKFLLTFDILQVEKQKIYFVVQLVVNPIALLNMGCACWPFIGAWRAQFVGTIWGINSDYDSGYKHFSGLRTRAIPHLTSMHARRHCKHSWWSHPRPLRNNNSRVQDIECPSVSCIDNLEVSLAPHTQTHRDTHARIFTGKLLPVVSCKMTWSTNS